MGWGNCGEIKLTFYLGLLGNSHPLFMKPKDPALFVLAFIMLVNALAYGTIIPLLYPYAARFGIRPVGLSLLFASFSIAQFIATPILGRLSDRVGRKPILLICIFGTSLSLALFAAASSVWMLFVARIIDGITGGNISVAQAMIADRTTGKDRAKSFGLLFAAFGVGFVAGPALGGIMSQFGLAAPFWFASALAMIGTLLGVVILKETLPKNQKLIKHEPLFKFRSLATALLTPITGEILLIGFLYSIAQNAFIIGVQPFTVDTLKMTTAQTGLMFTGIGVINILTQAIGLRILLNRVKNTVMLVTLSLLLSGATMAMLALPHSIPTFLLILFSFAILSSPITAITTGLLSDWTKEEDQGGILGLNQSYNSLGQVFGPLLAGLIVARYAVTNIFLMAGGFFLVAVFASLVLYRKPRHKLDL